MVWWRWFLIVNAAVLAIQIVACYCGQVNRSGFTWGHAFEWLCVANLVTLAIVLIPTS